jgi:hypothetical protein
MYQSMMNQYQFRWEEERRDLEEYRRRQEREHDLPIGLEDSGAV